MYYQQTDKSAAVSSKRAIEKIMMARHFTQEYQAVIKQYPLSKDVKPSSNQYNLIISQLKNAFISANSWMHLN